MAVIYAEHSREQHYTDMERDISAKSVKTRERKEYQSGPRRRLLSTLQSKRL